MGYFYVPYENISLSTKFRVDSKPKLTRWYQWSLLVYSFGDCHADCSLDEMELTIRQDRAFGIPETIQNLVIKVQQPAIFPVFPHIYKLFMLGFVVTISRTVSSREDCDAKQCKLGFSIILSRMTQLKRCTLPISPAESAHYGQIQASFMFSDIRKCYKIPSPRKKLAMTWDRAQQQCWDMGGRLASFSHIISRTALLLHQLKNSYWTEMLGAGEKGIHKMVQAFIGLKSTVRMVWLSNMNQHNFEEPYICMLSVPVNRACLFEALY